MRYAATDPLQGQRMQFDRLKRREFITLLGGVATLPLTARAQQAAKLHVVGYLGPTTPLAESKWTASFVQRLRELGWIERQDIGIEYRWAEGHAERFAGIAAEFVRLKVVVIVTSSTPSVIAAKQATSTIPIVFAAAGDPVGNKLASLARPGANVTGLSIQQTDTASKRVELFRDVVPGLRRLAILANVASPNAVVDMDEARVAAGTLGLGVVTSEIWRTEDIVPAFEALKGHADALYVCADPLSLANRNQIATLAQGARLPTTYAFREFVDAGGLISYGPNFPDLFWRTADIVDKILRGTRPADIPVEQPTKFELVINLKTASALGLTVPDKLIALADDVIE